MQREITGERIDFSFDKYEINSPIYFFLFSWIPVGVVLLWRPAAAFLSGRPIVISAQLRNVIIAFVLIGIITPPLSVLAIRRARRTVFTSDGVWQPGWLNGGTFVRWDEVQQAKFRGSRMGLTHLRLISRGQQKLEIRVTAYERPNLVVSFVHQQLGDRLTGEVPAEDPE